MLHQWVWCQTLPARTQVFFSAKFQFLVIEVTKCSRKKLVKFMFGCLHSERVDSQENAVET